MGLFFHYVTSNPPQPAFIFLQLIITEYRAQEFDHFLQRFAKEVIVNRFVWKFKAKMMKFVPAEITSPVSVYIVTVRMCWPNHLG